MRKLFPDDLTEQKQKLMAMLGTAVVNLHKLDTIVPAVQDLGRRHAGYGVTAEHYKPVGEALIWTLEQGLGEAFTPAVKAAWVEAYTTLAGTMQARSRNGSRLPNPAFCPSFWAQGRVASSYPAFIVTRLPGSVQAALCRRLQ